MNRSPIVVDTHFFHPERKTGAKNRGVATNIVTSTYPSPPSDTPYCFEAKESRLHRSWGVETPSAHEAQGGVCALRVCSHDVARAWSAAARENDRKIKNANVARNSAFLLEHK